jgi:hypothetical protein
VQSAGTLFTKGPAKRSDKDGPDADRHKQG